MDDLAWLSAHPPSDIDISMATLRRMRAADAEALVSAVNSSLGHLRPWMPWAQDPATAESAGAFLGGLEERWERRLEFTYFLWDGAMTVVGACGLHCRLEPGALEIGYWVHADHVGRGLATAAAGALTSAAFALPGVSRVEIHCDARNHPSAAVAERLGYELLRIDHRQPQAPAESGELMVWATWPPD